MIDLHTHTTASDGTSSPEALVDLAADKGLRAIAITDHDTVAGIPAALERGQKRGVLVIPGVELGAHWDGGGQMHILGYYINPADSYLLDRLSWLRARRWDRAAEIVKRLHAVGVSVSWDRVSQFAGSGSVGRPHVARALLEAGLVRSISEAFERYLNPGTPGFLKKVQFTSREAIELIGSSGGVAVLAHPATLKLSPEGLEPCVRRLISEGLKGIEAYWSKHDKSEISRYEELASRYGLIETGGSDFHGTNKPDIELGTRLNGCTDEDAVLRALEAARRQPHGEQWSMAEQPSGQGSVIALEELGRNGGDSRMHITVMGAGYAGLVVASGLAEMGNHVTCVDIDENKVALLKEGKMPIFEPRLADLVRCNREWGRLSFAVEGRQAIKDSLAVFLAVGTNSAPNGEADLGQVWSACDLIAQAMEEYKVVVIRSTVPVGTAADVEARIRHRLSHPVEFDVVSNPEFLREGSAVEDFSRPDRIVIGTASRRAAAVMKDLYRSLCVIETPLVFTTCEAAELIKYAANAFLALKISFVNELANLCDAIGREADVDVVANALGLDPRIGPTFLHPGPGFGGSCLPKDTLALSRIAGRYGEEFRTVEAAIEVNSRQYLRVVEKLKYGLGSLSGKVITVLGLAFKANTDDVRESRALKICRALLAEQCMVRVFDPVAMDNARRYLRHKHVIYCSDSYEAARGCDALVIATEWNEFRTLQLARVKQCMRGDFLVDAKNALDPAKVKSHGIQYCGMGRGLESDVLHRHQPPRLMNSLPWNKGRKFAQAVELD